jgi:tetratricopeptide (TPR) repeat protein
MLAGARPFEQSGSYSPLVPLIQAMAIERSRTVPSIRRLRPDVPWTLESIIRKALAPDPARRYRQAEHFAEDLRRFLEDRPLRYAPELSRVERFRKWVRRHPLLTSSGSVATAAALLLLAAGAALLGVRDHLARTREQLEVSQAQERRRAYESGTVQALCLVNTTTEVQDHLRQGITVCEKTLGLYNVLTCPDWQEDSTWQRLTPDEQHRLAEDTRELLMLLAWARVRTAAGDKAVLDQALSLLDRAEAIAGLTPSRALWEDRATYLDQRGDKAGAEAARGKARLCPSASARDHYALATTLARSGRYAEAIAELNQALRLNPRHYWSSVQRGICHQELGQLTLAAGDFGTCIGLWPEFAWGYFNRGCVLDQGGSRTGAVADYTAALERDPQFVLAYLNRGLMRLELKQYPEALADFQKATALGRDDATVHAGLAVALEGLGRPKEADGSFQKAFARAETSSPEVPLRLWWAYGFAVSTRLPDKAEEAFAKVLQMQPHHPQALYGQAMLLTRRGQTREAVARFNRALEANPGFAEARRYRAILLARLGHLAEATQDINLCLERDPDGGPANYAAACVAALAATKLPDATAAKEAAVQALSFLKKAFKGSYGRETAAQDPDLQGIRQQPGFNQLLGLSDTKTLGLP